MIKIRRYGNKSTGIASDYHKTLNFNRLSNLLTTQNTLNSYSSANQFNEFDTFEGMKTVGSGDTIFHDNQSGIHVNSNQLLD